MHQGIKAETLKLGWKHVQPFLRCLEVSSTSWTLKSSTSSQQEPVVPSTINAQGRDEAHAVQITKVGETRRGESSPEKLSGVTLITLAICNHCNPNPEPW